jgi:hypothetical protein
MIWNEFTSVNNFIIKWSECNNIYMASRICFISLTLVEYTKRPIERENNFFGS